MPEVQYQQLVVLKLRPAEDWICRLGLGKHGVAMGVLLRPVACAGRPIAEASLGIYQRFLDFCRGPPEVLHLSR